MIVAKPLKTISTERMDWHGAQLNFVVNLILLLFKVKIANSAQVETASLADPKAEYHHACAYRAGNGCVYNPTLSKNSATPPHKPPPIRLRSHENSCPLSTRMSRWLPRQNIFALWLDADTGVLLLVAQLDWPRGRR